MIQIEDTIVSFDIFVKKFCCDLAQCRGICCVEGDSGAPLEEDEPVRIETNYENIRAYMKPEGIAAVKEQGFSGIDQDGDLVTPLIQGGECAYAIEEKGCCCVRSKKPGLKGSVIFVNRFLVIYIRSG